MPFHISRAPVLTLWAAVVAERLGEPRDTALTLGRAVASSAARVKAHSIEREETKADRDRDTPRLRQVTAPVMLLGKEVRLLPNEDGELRAADGDKPADPKGVQRYLAIAFGEHLDEVRQTAEPQAPRGDDRPRSSSGFWPASAQDTTDNEPILIEMVSALHGSEQGSGASMSYGRRAR